MAIFQRPEAGAVVRDLNGKVAEAQLNVRDWGAVGNYSADDTDAIQACFDAAPPGATVHFPSGKDLATFRVTRQLNINNEICLSGELSRIVGDFTGDHASDDLLHFNVPIEMRNIVIERLTLNFNNGGRHAIYVGNASGKGALGWVIRNCVVAGGADPEGRAIVFDHIGTHFNRIRDNQIINGILLHGADGTIIDGNLIFGERCGVTVELANGAYKTQIVNNGITARDGGVFLRAAQQVDIENNQFEQGFDGARESNVNAFEVTPGLRVASHIIAYGGDEAVRDIRILGNNFGSGVNQEAAISLVGYTRDILIDENVFANLGTSLYDIRIFNETSAYTVIGERNRVYGITRTGLQSRFEANSLDPKALLRVHDNGKGSYGYAARKGKAALDLRNGWDATQDFAIWKGEDDRLHMTGGLIHGANAGGTLVGVLPPTMRPVADARFFWGGVHNVVASNLQTRLLVLGGTGEIWVQSAEVANAGGDGLGGTPTISWMHATQPIQGRAEYLSGPF
ncbi:glycosyl hydrolase family 28-related protein [Sphingomonas sp. IBVSS2]|uniref:glycosyl hydrolase family 28-related protein n=1 Tax=Sphingomonas sp. IBVSS2 TaxID=1985172 RepID=UPI0011818363|nr:NosD domain-containing protein [Sphingomonas sp. IBVSS2]